MPRPAPPLGRAPRVLLLRLGKLGDLMVSAALFPALRRAYPGARLSLLTLPRSLEFARALPELDEAQAWSPWSLPWLAARWRGRFDWLVDLNELPSRRSRLARRLFAPPRRAAFVGAEPGADLSLPARPKQSSHVLERMADAAAALGAPVGKAELRPRVPLDAERLSRAKAAAAQGLPVALNLSAGHPSRYWPLRRWRELGLALLREQPRASLQILHAPADAALAAELRAGLPQSRLRASPGEGLWDFLEAIASNRLLISPDTSAVHAACGLGVRVLGLYPEPAWNLASWGPWGRGQVALRSPAGGLEGLPLGPVRAAALRALRGLARPSSRP